jgi:hypothetical protein
MGNVLGGSPARVKEKQPPTPESTREWPWIKPDAMKDQAGEGEPYEETKVKAFDEEVSPSTSPAHTRISAELETRTRTIVAPAAAPSKEKLPTIRDAVAKEWYNEPAIIMWLAQTMFAGDADAMMLAGQNALLRAGDGAVLFISPELITLAWAARAFARRVLDESLKDAAPVDFAPVFVPQSGDVGEGCGCFPRRAPPKPPPYLRMTMTSAKRVEATLRHALTSGDGESMVGVAAKVTDTWPYHSNLPALRALVWSARVLGARFLNGDFGSTITPAEEAVLHKCREVVARVHALPDGVKLTPMATWRTQACYAGGVRNRRYPVADGAPRTVAHVLRCERCSLHSTSLHSIRMKAHRVHPHTRRPL